jgi:hypothetical protein
MVRAVRSPVRPATLWMWVVSMASARVIAGKMVVGPRVSLDVPAPGVPIITRYEHNACMSFRFALAARVACHGDLATRIGIILPPG